MNSNTPPISSQPQFLSLAISEITLDDTINTRPINYEIAAEYREAMLAYGVDSWQDHWNELPRITASKHLFSGFHTVTAVKVAFGADHILRCAVEGETYRDAFFLATGTNAQHGRRRSNAEKFESVLRWLVDEKEREWTNGHIAAQCQVTPQYVGRISKDLETDSSSEEWEYYADYRKRVHGEDTPTPYKRPAYRTFPKADGRFETMDTAKIGTTPSYDSQAQIQTDYKGMIKYRDAAHDKWKAYCEKWGIDFNWDDFCLYAEKHLDGSGCVSAINPEEATLDQIREKSLTWQKMKSAISGSAKWVVSHRAGLDFMKSQKAKEAKAEPAPDSSDLLPEKDRVQLTGLRSVLERLHREGVPENIVKDGKYTNTYETIEFERAFDDPQYAIDLANLYETTPENVLALRDEILADSEQAKEEEGSELEDSSTLETEQVSLLSNLYEHLSDDELLKRYRDFLERNPNNPHRLEGYRQLRGTAYARKLFDEIDEIDKPRLEDRKEDESKPDRKGLRKNLEAMVGSDTEPNPSILTKLYHVSEAEIHAEIEEVFGAEEEKPQKPPTPDISPPMDPPSNWTGRIWEAYNDTRAAYDAMMGGEPAQKVADKYWESFLAEAKKNAPRGKGLPRGNPTGEDGVYDKSTSTRIADAWKWISEQCRPPIQENKPNENEQKMIEMNMLERPPAECHPPRPDWLRCWTYDVACRMSDFNIVVHGLNYEGEIGRLEFQSPIPMHVDHFELIVAAIREAVDVEIQEFEENQEASKPKDEEKA